MGKDVRAVQKLRREVEKAKRALSAAHQVRVEVESLFEGEDFSETLTRAKFEELNMDLFRGTLKPVQKVLEDAKIEEVINEKIAWLEENADADADELKAQKKEMEDIVQPIIAKLYQGQGGAPPGEEGGEEDDEFKDEL